MLGVVRGIVVLLAVFAFVNAAESENNLSSLDNVAKLEDLSNNPATDLSDDAPQVDTKGTENMFVV